MELYENETIFKDENYSKIGFDAYNCDACDCFFLNTNYMLKHIKTKKHINNKNIYRDNEKKREEEEKKYEEERLYKDKYRDMLEDCLKAKSKS